VFETENVLFVFKTINHDEIQLRSTAVIRE